MPKRTTNLDQLFQIALQQHQAGRLSEAEQLYRQVLSQQPDHVDALHMLGVLAAQVGRHDTAVDLLRQAIARKPDIPDAHSNLGVALKDMGQLDDAIAAFRQAIAVCPNHPKALLNLGNALHEKGELDEAIAVYRQSIAFRPDYAEAHGNLGVALKDKGQLDEAIVAFRQAIALRPNYSEAYGNLGAALHDQGKLDEAIAACRQAIAFRPNDPEAHSNISVALREKGQLDEAIAACQQAIALRPNYPEALFNLGSALYDKGQMDEAIAAFRQAIALRPNYPEAWNNLANALKGGWQMDEAIAAYRQATALNPNFPQAHSNLVLVLIYHPGFDPCAIAEELRRWNQQHAAPLSKFILPHRNDRTPDRRLQIGYVSADFRSHASAFFLDPLLRSHDRAQFEIFCYGQVAKPDAYTRRFQSICDGWRSTVGLSDEQVADQVREDAIDILVDLKLHTTNHRLLAFARKPAPVVVTWLGYPGSTGLATIDYRLSDPHLDPPGCDTTLYTEQTVRLPHTFWCYDPLESRHIPVAALPAQTNNRMTFGCLNSFCKINDSVLRLWAQVLLAVPSSHLLLLASEGSHRQRALEVLQREGIASTRIEFVAPQKRRQYMELYHRIDVGLDTFPYNGHTTSLDSFWMGVPVITLVGQSAVGRAGLCQLMNLDLPDLIARTRGQYIQIAAALANDPHRLAELRATLRPRMEQSPLMDAPRFARDMEAAYRQMWTRWCRGR